MSPEFLAFWQERHLCTLTTLRPDGTPHVVPVGATVDGCLVRVITDGGSAKVRHIRVNPWAVVSQVDGRRWTSIEGPARVLDDPAEVELAEARYATRYRVPRVNPNRVVIEVTIERVLGTVQP
ncbi:PPOX class probable F420-dependent enzyme [Actinokineospora baliensis]|uniref:PPOX class F420-dependent oxidoreductase n=1 Tax=Actinokineospora baliensis TaxID=547056 RepID=UPI00195C1D9A|nr:PPOX class F420-dependent oxidoreductase [Actinokineospora baliensis]MBM7773574.1 PPOX class probable F420-dependent enzyme [Actinokineospora baliensis]